MKQYSHLWLYCFSFGFFCEPINSRNRIKIIVYLSRLININWLIVLFINTTEVKFNTMTH